VHDVPRLADVDGMLARQRDQHVRGALAQRFCALQRARVDRSGEFGNLLTNLLQRRIALLRTQVGAQVHDKSANDVFRILRRCLHLFPGHHENLSIVEPLLPVTQACADCPPAIVRCRSTGMQLPHRRTSVAATGAVSAPLPMREGETAIGVHTLFSGVGCHADAISFA
jgi:hypothetical protein